MADLDKIKEFFTFKSRNGETREERLITSSTGKYEISLLPAVKLEMIRSQKVRNFVLFGAIVVVSASIGMVVLLGGVKLRQDIEISDQDKKIDKMSAEMTQNTQYTDVLTVQDQLNKIEEIGTKKKVLSRVFSLLTVLLPTGADRISLSELNVNLDDSTLNFEAQADAGKEPLIDYRVLEAFMKSVKLMNYDYGRYVTTKDTDIPTMCIEEVDSDGNMYSDERSGDIYAVWQRNKTDCLPDGVENLSNEELRKYNTTLEELTEENEQKSEDDQLDETELEAEALKTVVESLPSKKIWRTPQYKKWYEDKQMTLSGEISGVEHFKSSCITYSGEENEEGKVNWKRELTCKLATEEGVVISDSANGRDTSNNLVLSFTAALTIDEGFFQFSNKHVMAIGPFGQNVTDSYLQTEGIFVPPAKECAADDADCMTNKRNSTGE